MTGEGRLQLRVRSGLGRLGQRFHQLLLGVIDVAQLFDEQLVDRAHAHDRSLLKVGCGESADVEAAVAADGFLVSLNFSVLLIGEADLDHSVANDCVSQPRRYPAPPGLRGRASVYGRLGAFTPTRSTST
jgi:hypothetical protein